MDLFDPAFLIAVVVAVGGLLLFLKIRKGGPQPPRCPDCHQPMELEREIVDPEHPELRFIPGERRGEFRCPDCGKRTLARY